MALQVCLDILSFLQDPKRNNLMDSHQVKRDIGYKDIKCTKFDWYGGVLSCTNIQSLHLASFLIAGNCCFLNVYNESIYFNTIFIHKKRFRGAVLRDCSGNHNFSRHLICGCKQVLIWNIRFFSFSIYLLIL